MNRHDIEKETEYMVDELKMGMFDYILVGLIVGLIVILGVVL